MCKPGDRVILVISQNWPKGSKKLRQYEVQAKIVDVIRGVDRDHITYLPDYWRCHHECTIDWLRGQLPEDQPGLVAIKEVDK